MVTATQDQKVRKSWLVIPFLYVPKLLKLYGIDRKSFTSELSSFLGITLEGISREMHTLFSMGSWLASTS